jgi:hypothetical protein
VRAVINMAGKICERYGPFDAVTVLYTAAAIAEQNTGVRPGHGNKILADVRRSVAAAAKRLGDEATPLEIALELDLLGEE